MKVLCPLDLCTLERKFTINYFSGTQKCPFVHVIDLPCLAVEVEPLQPASISPTVDRRHTKHI